MALFQDQSGQVSTFRSCIESVIRDSIIVHDAPAPPSTRPQAVHRDRVLRRRETVHANKTGEGAFLPTKLAEMTRLSMIL